MDALLMDDRRRRRRALLGGLLLAVIAAGATYFVLTRPGVGGPSDEPPKRTVVVAAVAIPARTLITAAMLTTAQVVDSPVLASADSDPQRAVGQVAAIDIAQGQPISANLYGGGTVGGVAILSPEETVAPDSPLWRAVSVMAPPDRAVGGLLRPGDHVDLFVTLNPQIFNPDTESTYTDKTTKLMWSNLQLLAVDVDKNLYVLRVDEAQAEEIAHVQSTESEFTIGLRPTVDTREPDRADLGQTTSDLIEKYGFPIPVEVTGPRGTQPTPSALPNLTASPTPTP